VRHRSSRVKCVREQPARLKAIPRRATGFAADSGISPRAKAAGHLHATRVPLPKHEERCRDHRQRECWRMCASQCTVARHRPRASASADHKRSGGIQGDHRTSFARSSANPHEAVGGNAADEDQQFADERPTRSIAIATATKAAPEDSDRAHGANRAREGGKETEETGVERVDAQATPAAAVKYRRGTGRTTTPKAPPASTVRSAPTPTKGRATFISLLSAVVEGRVGQ